ncbi:MAG: hypothetical protein KKA81_01325 [Bacteroidetes bacterium]|nr:hypothetical protein [Bacteroidota bacterium]
MNTKIVKLFVCPYIFFILVTLFLFQGKVQGQTGARAASLANATVADNGFWAIMGNPAGLNGIQGIQGGLSIADRFLVSELRQGTFALAVPVNRAHTGFSLSRYGFGLYSENRAGIIYSGQILEKLCIGAELHYTWIVVGESKEQEHRVNCNLGMIFKANETLFLGLHTGNPVSFFQDDPTELPCIRLGAKFLPSQEWLILFEVDKTLYRPISWKAGMEISLLQQVFLRTGISVPPLSLSFGAGYINGHFTIDLASAYHYVLGFSPQLSIIYSFNK